jgi:class 3 adenylate cyclase
MAIHTGESILTEEGYVGLALHRGARIAAVHHGGQLLVSQAIRAPLPEARDRLTLRDLGEHRPKDLSQPRSL